MAHPFDPFAPTPPVPTPTPQYTHQQQRRQEPYYDLGGGSHQNNLSTVPVPAQPSSPAPPLPHQHHQQQQPSYDLSGAAPAPAPPNVMYASNQPPPPQSSHMQSQHQQQHQQNAPAGDANFFGGVDLLSTSYSGISVSSPPQPQHQHQQHHQQPRTPAKLLVPSKTMNMNMRKASIGSSYSIRSASSLGSRSIGSHASQYQNGNGNGNAAETILNDKTFAPPPKFSQSLEVTKSQYLHINRQVMSTLPSFGSVKHSGECLARFSLKSMMIKKWKPTFWIAFGNHQILFFRSRSDFEEWVSNPFLKKEERDQLVKLSVDFVNDRHGKNVEGYAISRLTSKAYHRDGYMHHFKLEKWYSYGPSIAVAIGGKNENEMRNLRTVMAAMMECHPQKLNVKQFKVGDLSDSEMSSYYDSESASGRSASANGVGSRNGSSVGSIMTSGSSAYSHSHSHDSRKKSMGRRRKHKKGLKKSKNYQSDLGTSSNEHEQTHQPHEHPDVAARSWKERNASRVATRSHPYEYDLGASPTRSPNDYDSHPDSRMTRPEEGGSSSRSRKFFRSKSRDPKERKDTRTSRSKEPNKEKKSILRKGLFGRKNKNQDVVEPQVQYYVGRPNNQQDFHYRAER